MCYLCVCGETTQKQLGDNYGVKFSSERQPGKRWCRLWQRIFQVWGETAFSKRRLSVSALTPSITASAVCLSIHTAGSVVYSRYCQTEEDACQSLSSVSSALAPCLQDSLLLPLVPSLFVLYSLQSPSVCCYFCSSRLHQQAIPNWLGENHSSDFIV